MENKTLIILLILLFSLPGIHAISNERRNILIYEVSPYPYSGVKLEYVCLINPSEKDIDITSYEITDLEGYLELRGILKSMEKIYIAENRTQFYHVMGFYPDYTYGDLKINGTFALANSGDEVILRENGKIIDAVIYGNSNFSSGWNGEPLKISEGHVLRRKNLIDTDSPSDWTTYHRIGQSNFNRISFKSDIEIFTYPDDRNEVYRFLTQARKRIMIESYTMSDEKFGELLVKKLKEGVNVSILLEGNPVGGMSNEEKYIVHWIYLHGGKIYFMVNSGKLKNRYTFVHSKFIIRDEKDVLISTENFDLKTLQACGNRGYGIIVKNKDFGEYMERIFREDTRDAGDIWVYNGSYSKVDENFNLPLEIRKREFKSMNLSAIIEPVIAPDFSLESFDNFVNSQSRVDVESLYIKDYPLSKIYGKANRILVEEETENYTMKRFDGEYHNIRELHAKLLIGNSSIFVGSINFCLSSLTRNREVSLIIKSKKAVNYFEKVFNYDWSDEEDLIAYMKIKKEGNKIKVDLSQSIGKIKEYRIYVDGKIVYHGKDPVHEFYLGDGVHTIKCEILDLWGKEDSATTEIDINNNFSIDPIIFLFALIFAVFIYKVWKNHG